MLLYQACKPVVILRANGQTRITNWNPSAKGTHITFEAIEDLSSVVLQAYAELKTPRDTKPAYPFNVGGRYGDDFLWILSPPAHAANCYTEFSRLC